MDEKPTYEELEQRNKELEKEALNYKRLEKALQESEKRFKNVTNSIEELIVLVDQNFKIQLINSTLAQAWNISLDDCAGKYCYELFYGRKHICEGCPAIKVLDEGKVIRAALRYRPDGRIYDRTAYPSLRITATSPALSSSVVILPSKSRPRKSFERVRKNTGPFWKPRCKDAG